MGQEYAEITSTPPALCFVATSGTGKTTLLEQVIQCLQEAGVEVGALKHDAHHFNIDHPGKDSYRFTCAGAKTMLIASSSKIAMVKQSCEPAPENLIRKYFSDCDLVLAEGYRKSRLPCIALFRQDHLTRFRLDEIENCIAVAADFEVDTDLPLLNINNPKEVARFVCHRFLPCRERVWEILNESSE